MKCVSGKHEWLSPVSAKRCCVPGWRRELCIGNADDARAHVIGGESAIDGISGAMFIWRFTGAPSAAKKEGAAA